jgi:hypothetical protein
MPKLSFVKRLRYFDAALICPRWWRGKPGWLDILAEEHSDSLTYLNESIGSTTIKPSQQTDIVPLEIGQCRRKWANTYLVRMWMWIARDGRIYNDIWRRAPLTGSCIDLCYGYWSQTQMTQEGRANHTHWAISEDSGKLRHLSSCSWPSRPRVETDAYLVFSISSAFRMHFTIRPLIVGKCILSRVGDLHKFMFPRLALCQCLNW